MRLLFLSCAAIACLSACTEPTTPPQIEAEAQIEQGTPAATKTHQEEIDRSKPGLFFLTDACVQSGQSRQACECATTHVRRHGEADLLNRYSALNVLSGAARERAIERLPETDPAELASLFSEASSACGATITP